MRSRVLFPFIMVNFNGDFKSKLPICQFTQVHIEVIIAWHYCFTRALNSQGN